MRLSSRIGWCLLCALTALGLLAACDDTRAPSAPARQTLAKTMLFYDWADDMPQSVLDDFAREYGVRVEYRTYESAEEALESLRAGHIYDVAVIESRLVPSLMRAALLAELDHRNLPNFKNLSPNFRDLAYDPGNRHSIPFNWGTTALVVRRDLVAAPVTRWSDLWDPRYAGRVGLWMEMRRDVIALALKSLGYSANSEVPEELAAALERLRALKPRALKLEDVDPVDSAEVLGSGRAVIAMGFARDVLEGRKRSPEIAYVMPTEGALLWGDNFVIPAASAEQYTAELFINFLLRPDISARIANENHYATTNEAALPLIDPAIRNDPVVFPANEDMQRSELMLPLSPEGEQQYAELWERFVRDTPERAP
jgi:spermidine/putrescine transport system substrate-binding protein